MRKFLPLFLLLLLLPANAQVAQKKPHTVTLKWNAPPVGTSTERVIGYNVYRSEEEHGKYTVIARKVTAQTYTDADLKFGHTYYYRVTSVAASGRESTAAVTKATIPAN